MKAEWLESVQEAESKLQKGVFERVLNFRTGGAISQGGKYKLWQFSKLFRELATSGLSSIDDLNALVEMGAELGIQERWEKLPPK